MKKIYPLLITDKLKECADFYVEHFEFEKVFEQDWYIQLLHKKSGAELAFMVPDAENQPKELHPAFSGKGLVYSFEVEDAKKEYERLKGKLDIFFELTTEEWGQTHFMIIGPAGEVVDVVQQPAEA